MNTQHTRRGFTQQNVILNLFQDLHLRRGFTLIELLVVVLIIGILTAVAVPQYRLATDKARLQKLVSMTNAVSRAQDAFYLAHGTYTTNWNELDVTFPGTVKFNDQLHLNEGWTLHLFSQYVDATDSKIPNIVIYSFYSQHYWSRKSACYAKAGNDYANKLCQNLSNKSTKDTSADYNTLNVYLF